jgi:Fur family ferric uptake transcriptional regulator
MDLRKLLKDSGLRCTHARLAVLRVLQSEQRPVTHAEVAKKLAKAELDSVSVYRNLVKLAAAGIVARIDFGDHLWRFELRRMGSSDTHPHFLCVNCGEVSCLPDSSMVATPSQRKQLAAVAGNVLDILVRGHCRQCG